MKKRHSLVFLTTITGAEALCSFMACNSLKEKNSPPNVILVLTDDQGYGDFSVLGNPVLKTPYLFI